MVLCYEQVPRKVHSEEQGLELEDTGEVQLQLELDSSLEVLGDISI